MSILKLDKKGNLTEDNGIGEFKQAEYVESNHLAYGEYGKAAEKVLNKIKRDEQIRKNKVIIRKKELLDKYNKQMGAMQLAEVKRNLLARSRQKSLEARKNRLFVEAAKQPNMGYDYSNLIGKPTSGFQNDGKYLRNINLNGEGRRARIRNVGHFGASSILGTHEYDGMVGWSPLDLLSDVANAASGAVQTVYKTVVIKAPQTITSTVAKGAESAASAGVNVIQEKAAPTFLSALKATGNAAVSAVESPAGMMARKIIFNKYTDPGQQLVAQYKFLHSVPLLGPAMDTVDRYSGGTLTNINIAAVVPGKLARGEPVTKAELITAAVVALQAGAIVASGGTAAAVIVVLAGNMKQGPLGKTKEGRTLLTIAEIAGVAYTLGGTGAAAGASAAGTQAGAQAGTQVAQKTATEAVVAALKQKAQQELAKKAAEELAKKTGTGVLGQIAISSALGPGTYQEAAVSAGKQAAVYETGKAVGPEGAMIAQAAITAGSIANADTSGKPISEIYAKQLAIELQDRIRKEAVKRAEAELIAKVGKDNAGMMIAYAKGDSLESIAKAKVDAKQEQIMNNQLAGLNKQVSDINAQKAALTNAIQLASPENREKLLAEATALDTQVVLLNTERNPLRTELGLASIQNEARLSNNAALVGVPLSATDTSSTMASREAMAEQIKNEEAKKLVALEKVYYDYVIKTQNAVSRLKELTEQEAILRAAGNIVDADALIAQLLGLNKEVNLNEAKAIEYQKAMEVQKMQSAAKVAAAQEGRYKAYYIEHPMTRYGLA